MRDIVDRLRETPCNREPFTPSHAECQCRVTHEAADAIEALRQCILAALDNLHHDDAKGARRVLERDPKRKQHGQTRGRLSATLT